MTDTIRAEIETPDWPISDDFSPPWHLRSAHMQSLAASIKLRRLIVNRYAKALKAAAEDVVLDCGHGVRLHGVYSKNSSDNGKLLVLIHGWEGSAESLYLLSSAAYHYDLGYSIFRLHLRDHGPSHHLNEDLFHSCRIDEVVQAVKRIAERYQPKRLLLGGFSLGGNFALRVGVRAPANDIPLEQVVAISPVLKPNNTLWALERGWWGYDLYFQIKWRRSLRKKAAHFPHRYNYDDIRSVKGLREMTKQFVLAYSEYDDLEQYLDGYALTDDALEPLTVPSRIITALDDPMIPAADIDNIAKPASLDITLTRYGGHCGYFERLRGPSWADREMAETFLHAPD